MSTPQIENVEMVDLEFTRTLRKGFINNLMPNGEFPESQENRAQLLTALNDMDRASLSRLKIKSDNALAKAQQATAQVMTNVINSLASQQKAAIEGNYKPVTDVEATFENAVPGETDIGTLPVDIEKLIESQD